MFGRYDLFLPTITLGMAKKISASLYNRTEIKQYAKVKYLGCILDESLFGDSMALNVINKVNWRLKFLHRQKHPLCIDSYVMH